MRRRGLLRLYSALAVAGAAIPLAYFLPWLGTHGLDVRLFLAELFATRIGAFFAWDVFISAAVVPVLVLAEGRRLGMRRLYLPIAATFCVGVSFGLPLFLAMRELHLGHLEDAASRPGPAG